MSLCLKSANARPMEVLEAVRGIEMAVQVLHDLDFRELCGRRYMFLERAARRYPVIIALNPRAS